jgi:hypothetical protein
MLMNDGYHQTIGPWRRRSGRSCQRQTGAATLAVAVIMLLVVSVLVFHSHTAGWLEQRATANQARAKQAHAAAEAGIEVALSALNTDTSRGTYLELDPSGKLKAKSGMKLLSTSGAGPSYSVSVEDVSTPDNTFRLVSTGGSDCATPGDLDTCTGRASVSQVVRVIGFSGLPAISVSSDPPFANQAAFFENIFGASQTDVKALTIPINSSGSLGVSTSGLVWHEGNLTLGAVNVGAANNPVLLIVAGDLTLDSGAVVYGFVHVTGNLICNSCDPSAIQGAVAIGGTSGLTAANVEKVPNVLTRLNITVPRFAKVLGTWRDW